MTAIALNNNQTAISSEGLCSAVDASGPVKTLVAIPGQSITYTARVLAGRKIRIKTLADDGVTLETTTNHCLSPRTPIHICFNSGLCATELPPCIRVKTTPTDNTFTLEDLDGNDITFVPTVIDDPTPDEPGTPVTGWLSRAANLTGFVGRLTLRVNDSRVDTLLGVGAIRSQRNQLQVKGAWDDKLAVGDRVTLKDFTGTVEAFRALKTCDDVPYTVIQTDAYAEKDIPFTSDFLVYFQARPLVLEGVSEAPSCGWLTVTLAATDTVKLLAHKDKSAAVVGTWSFALSWGNQSLPSHMNNRDLTVWSAIFDGGVLVV